MKNPGIGFILAGLAIILFFVLDAVFTSGVRERERQQYRERDDRDRLLDQEPPEEDPYARFREEILGTDDDVLTREEMRHVYDGRDYTYTIRSGDSLRAIAKKYLGDEKMVSVLKEHNPTLRQGTPRSGTKIVIPMKLRR